MTGVFVPWLLGFAGVGSLALSRFVRYRALEMALDWNCRAVLFDMDGVLLDTEPLYTVAYDRMLEPYGAALDPATKLEIMGRPALLSAAHVIGKFGIPLTAEEFVERRKPILAELFANAPAVPGAEEFVRRLSSRGVPIAVATSTGRTLFDVKTKNHEWFSLFNAVVCGDDPEVARPKPAPDIFLVAARRLGVPPEDCAIFEDSPAGVQAASATGGRVFALVREPLDTAVFAGAARIVATFDEAGVCDPA